MSLMRINGLLALCAVAGSAAAAAPPQAMTDAGRVQGTLSSGVKSWKGIPFAEPPVGANRWRAPQPAAKWSEVRDASEYGHDCMQLPFPSDAAPLGTAPSEDCLVLNVWAPEGAAKGAKLPVVAWMYGGGFLNGGSSPPTYSGANLARKGVIFVSFNYRLGRFGTFVHPRLTAETSGGEPVGNYGFMDQLAALRWIKRNVASFGGNPGNVTLIGESAGGMSVITMLTSPMAKGLFHRTVIMSGGDGRTSGAATGRAQVEQASLTFAASKGIAANDPEALAKLRALPADAVVDGLNLEDLFNPTAGSPTFAGPFVDGKLAVDPASAFDSGRFSHVPVMIGATSNDIGGATGYMVTGARALAGKIGAAGVPVYKYRFSYVASSVGKAGADHATDIPFFFGTEALKYGDQSTARDLRMGLTISTYLVNFAVSGNPNGKGLPTWPSYKRTRDKIMNFAANGRAVPGDDPLIGALDAASVDLPAK